MSHMFIFFKWKNIFTWNVVNLIFQKEKIGGKNAVWPEHHGPKTPPQGPKTPTQNTTQKLKKTPLFG